ncbi:MAG: efflux RND transporter permease subunit [Candidatus Thiosymbion ectosymbiont of Robbea hypermnestra]|nr:efflux RND transporter permease subunit [Candidatus Thiosymbion ectosymbiont of Robbea hypermnestra]
MESVVRFTLGQQVLFNLVFVLLTIAGVFAVGRIPVERYPEINFGKVVISAFYPGASPQDVESLVTVKIEEALEGLEQVEFIRSSSVRERSAVLVKFRDDTDYDALYDELRFRVLGALGELPAGIDPPDFQRLETSVWLPVVAVNLVGERSNRALTLLAEELRVPLSRIPGVDEAKLDGEYQREFHVYLDPRRMSAQGVSFEQVARALTDANLTIPAGDYQDASGEFVVRVDERFRSREQLVATPIRRDADGSLVVLADLISRARVGYRDPHIITSVNGRDCVTIRVLKAPAGNALRIRQEVRRIVEEQAPSLARQGVELVLTQDSSLYIRASVSTLGWNLALGIVLVCLILWYFMGLRNAGLVTVGIPFAFLVTMILMELTGNSLNELTLFSFVLISGIIVDDAIVVVENIYRHVQQGEPLEQAIVEGTAEVMLPVISATATTVAAFLPMLMMTGSTGEFFALIPKAVSFAIVASLFECLFILPLHYLDFGPRPRSGGASAAERDNALLRVLRRGTEGLIRLTLRGRYLSLVLAGVCFLVAVAILGVSIAGIAPLIRIKFFPDDYNLYYAFIEGPADTTIERTDAMVREIARSILADGPGYARSAAGAAGFVFNEDYEQEFGHNLGTVTVPLPDRKERAFQDPIAHLEAMRERLNERFGGQGFTIRMRAEKDGPPTGKDVNIRIVGANERAVSALSEELLRALRESPELGPHLIDLEDDRGRPARVFRLAVDQSKARELGLTPGEAARLAAAVLDGRYLGDYRLSDEEVDLKLRIDPAYLDAPEAALSIPLREHPAGPVRLGDLVRPVVEIQPGERRRYRGQRSLTITADIAPGAPISSPQVAAWVKQHYARVRDRFAGATLVFGGEFEETQRSFDSLIRAFGLAILLIYLILATQFKSYAQPLIVLSAIMFSITGVVFGTLATQTLFTVNSFIAVVGVTGVVVNDSLVLLDFINRRYREGKTRREAVTEGVHVRLRPIVLTTLTTSLGLLPMALGIPSYSLIWGSMASTFVTGLATATFLTLFIVPVAWDLLMEAQERRIGKRRQKTTAGA